MKSVAFTNFDVQIVILFTPDKQADSLKYDIMSIFWLLIIILIIIIITIIIISFMQGIYTYMRPLGRPRRRWADNIRMDLQEVGFVYMDWIGLAQDRDRWRTLVSAVMNLRVP